MLLINPLPQGPDGRFPVVSDGAHERSSGKIHMAVDVMYPRKNEPKALPWASQNYYVFPNTPVLASGPGLVTISKTIGTGGYVQIDHGNSLKTQYMHLTGLKKKPGDKVKAGERIGTVGWDTSGYKLAHLHWEIIYGGEKIDPEPIFNKLNVIKYSSFPWLPVAFGLACAYAVYVYDGKIPLLDDF